MFAKANLEEFIKSCLFFVYFLNQDISFAKELIFNHFVETYDINVDRISGFGINVFKRYFKLIFQSIQSEAFAPLNKNGYYYFLEKS